VAAETLAYCLAVFMAHHESKLPVSPSQEQCHCERRDPYSLAVGGQGSRCNHNSIPEHHDSMVTACCTQSVTLSSFSAFVSLIVQQEVHRAYKNLLPC